MSTGALSPWVKREGHEAGHSIACSAEANKDGAYLHSAIYLHSIVFK
jgi:hypothetical protein